MKAIGSASASTVGGVSRQLAQPGVHNWRGARGELDFKEIDGTKWQTSFTVQLEPR